MLVNSPIHPDDILFFQELCNVMRSVAKEYNLPLRSITGFPMPAKGMADRLGDCCITGDIRMVLRCAENGIWADAPLDPEKVWETAAHELAHLKHHNHGEQFQLFTEELIVAVRNRRGTQKQKLLVKLAKMQEQAKSEAALGNEAAAEAFASALNKMMLRYELEPSDLDYVKISREEPIIELRIDLGRYGIKDKAARSAWQENLAGAVARAHLCQILVRPNSNQITFVGTKAHATVAEYVYGTIAPFVEKMSKKAEYDYWVATGCGRGVNNQAKGFRGAWIDAFVGRIWERFKEAREAAIAETTTTETGLVRLEGALLKVKEYVNNKFKSTRAASIGNHRGLTHAAGRAAGREAANRVTLGQKGISSAPSRKMLE